LTEVPPYAVEGAIKRLGQNLRTARLRRNLTIQEVADRIGTGMRAVADAEKVEGDDRHRRLYGSALDL